MPGNEWLENHRQAFVQPPTVVMLLRTQGLLEAPLNDFGMWFARSFGCSLFLSRWRKVGLPLEVWQKSWPNFKGITKGKWSRHQSLGFSKVWLVTYF